ncbi:uncharacterized protein LOC119899082 isoform X2 [Micropterus salmoides]|uniref:uncharacterized protein LOC119899082 isoform X2 n=1 Tax=Micropterus salmoides TaxID=27706 RepID=UPI0018EB46B4|nr:uncharacterized protein LOC119899082 isoform X2 [Micropterus salmoides]
MTRVALAKLLILLIIALIICLPEFFTLHRASKVSFLCLPYRPCERRNQVRGNGKTGDTEIRGKDMCDPSQVPEREKWEEACAQENQSNMTDPASDSWRDREDPEKSWFMCETDMDMAELHSNSSSSALKVHFKVSVELQFRDAKTLNLTLYGGSNQSSLLLNLPEEEEEEEEDEEEEKNKDDEGQRKAFYCCFPASPTSESANQSRCLLWLANQTVLTATEKGKLPWKRPQKDEWRCVFRVLWLALLFVVLLAVVTTLLRQIYSGRCLLKKPKVRPVVYHFTGQHLNDGEKHTESIIPKETILHSYGSRPWSANLHHRSHPSTSSLTEEQAW